MILRRMPWLSSAALLSWALPAPALAAGGAAPGQLADFTATGYGLVALAVFVVAYGCVIAEEFTQLRKSKALLVAAGVIWALVGLACLRADVPGVDVLFRHELEGYSELLLFLFAAMTYVNTLQERNIFGALRDWLIGRGFSLRALFWITGVLAFFISPVLDNLTTALVMGAVVLAVGAGHPGFVMLACANIVVAANAGGAYSPFGDITTLMVWQAGVVRFEEFFRLFLPAAVNWLVPAIAMTFAVPRAAPTASGPRSAVKPGGYVVLGLFALTIAMTVAGHNFLHLPPVLGMMTGLGLLSLLGYAIRRRELKTIPAGNAALTAAPPGFKPATKPFDIFVSMKRVEWDTLMFFYGVVLSVGGLGALGYLHLLASATYADHGPLVANVLVGIASAVVDNIPIMFAVLSMDPEMSHGHWLLVTFTAGVGGSLLSIGSAAGVALMGQARGVYTFFGHLRWSWAIALGYVLGIWTHLAVNAALF